MIWTPVIRNIDARKLFENFFIFSVASILGIRIFLKLTHYPQFGAGSLHIAHLLWGGFFMVTALMLFFLYLNKAIQQLASILAGIGFGAFIDELGKFITADNNYFYRPTFALIYSIFVLLYIVFQLVTRRTKYTPDEYIANALEATKEAVIHDFDIEERQQALDWLSKSGKNKFSHALTNLLQSEVPISMTPSLLSRLRSAVTDGYQTILTRHWMIKVGIIFFSIQSVGYLIFMTLLLVVRNTVRGYIVELRLGFFGWGLIISLIAAVSLLVIGLVLILYNSRRQAYRFFEYSLLTNILLVTFFVFYYNQLLALVNLIVNYSFLKTFSTAQTQEQNPTVQLI